MTSRSKRLQELHIEARWRRYADDPILFFSECLWVPAGNKLGGRKGRVRLELFDYQTDTIDQFRNNRYVVVMKARQLGLTTITMAYALWLLMFRPGANIVLVSKNQTTADKALELIDFMWRFLPESLRARGPMLENNAAKHHSYRFRDGMVSNITSYAATKTVAAGQTASLVIWDEAALAEYQEDVLRTLLPTTDAGGSMIVFSTPRGGHNTFAQLFRDAQRGENDFKAIFHPWHVSRLVSNEDYEAKKRAMRNEPWLFFAEYPSSVEEGFRQSGRSRFVNLPPEEDCNHFDLRGFLNPSDGRFEFDPEGPLRMHPSVLDGVPYGAKAIVAIDPSLGSGGDFTAITFGWALEDGTPFRAGFWHANMVEPADVAAEAAALGRMLASSDGQDALIVVEKQGGYGDTIIHELRERLFYQNLYRFTYTGHRRYRSEQSYGFPMTFARRPLVIDALARWVDYPNSVMVGVDPLLRQELGAFVVREDGRVMADAGMYDDLVMSAAIWVYVLLERGETAMVEPMIEHSQRTYSVSHIFEEAEKVRRAEQRVNRRQRSRLARLTR